MAKVDQQTKIHQISQTVFEISRYFWFSRWLPSAILDY